MAGSWTLCYFFRPSSFLQSDDPSPWVEKLSIRFEEALVIAESKVARLFSSSSLLEGLDSKQLVRSLAESIVIRTLLKPALVPLKLWLTHSLVNSC
eukprot:754321-Hanusia_phi.AAC.1